MEPSLNQIQPEDRFQFERHGYFIADHKDTEPGKPVFNRAVTLRDSWEKSLDIRSRRVEYFYRRVSTAMGTHHPLRFVSIAHHKMAL